MIRYGICVDWNQPAQLEAARAAGADYVELGLNSFEHAPAARAEELALQLKELGLPVLSFNCTFPWQGLRVTGRAVEDERIDAYLESVLAKTDVLAAPYVVFGSAGARHMEEGDKLGTAQAQILRLLRDRVVPAFARHRRTLVLEPLSEDNLIRTVAEGMMYVSAVNHPRIQVLADFYHTGLLGEDLEEMARFDPHIKHTHIASPSNGRHIPLPGDGDEDYYRRVMALLRDIHYCGGLSLEGAAGEDYAAEWKTSLAYLRSLA